MMPAPLSPGECAFEMHCRAYLSDIQAMPAREVEFCEGRKWRWDFCWPDRMVAVEIDGGTRFGRSAHSRGDGYVRDCQKANAGAYLGWKVYRFTTAMVMSGEAIDFMRKVLS